MKTICTTVYSFDELSEAAQRKAISNQYDCNVDYEWWDCTYDDAKENSGLKITGFDTGRGSYVSGEFTEDACASAYLILENHGETCETHKTASQFIEDRDKLVNSAPKDENGDFEDECELDSDLDDLENEYLKDLCGDYLSILRKEYEYLTSEEAIKETILANDWTFTEAGEMMNS